MTKQGKSRDARGMVTGKYGNLPCIVNDVNNEWGATRRDRDTGVEQPSVGLTEDNNLPRSRYIGGNMDEYLSIVERKRYTTCVFEESSAFFKGATSKRLTSLVINKGHTYNNYVFLFHSIRTIPPGLLDFTDILCLYKTGDTEEIVKAKAPALLPYWYALRRKANGAPPVKLDWLNTNYDPAKYERLKYLAENLEKIRREKPNTTNGIIALQRPRLR